MKSRRIALTALTCPLIVLSLLAQTAPKKPAPTKTNTDTWERSKECAAQAEKVMRWLYSNDPKVIWQNHYSPKYDRCFLKTSRELDAKKVEEWTGTLSETDLYDAFERSMLATFVTAVPASPRFEVFCEIDDKEKIREDCEAATDFITKHMKD
jgi:hypothetical protein